VLFAWVIVASLAGSVGAIAGAALLLVFPGGIRKVLVPLLVSYATGTLLGAAFLGMIPAGLAQAPALAITGTTLAGIVLFFVLEKLTLWRHSHEQGHGGHGQAGPLILIGDAFHNFVDGVLIAAAFLTAVPLGVATTWAVVAHEVPQEVGDFAILLDSGYGRARALALNALSSLATLPGAVLAYFFLSEARGAVPYILALSAASFIYIATADLIPGLHRQVTFGASLRQLVLLLVGIATIAAFHVHL
jgi:zinc and cadmium transporter